MGSIWIIWRNNKAKWFANDFIELNSLDWIKCHNAGAGSEGFIGWSWRGLVWKTSWNPFRHVGGSRIVSHSSQLNLLLGSYNHASAIDVFIKTQKRCETNHLLISKILLHFIKTAPFLLHFPTVLFEEFASFPTAQMPEFWGFFWNRNPHAKLQKFMTFACCCNLHSRKLAFMFGKGLSVQAWGFLVSMSFFGVVRNSFRCFSSKIRLRLDNFRV